jgi:hypothetical protein
MERATLLIVAGAGLIFIGICASLTMFNVQYARASKLLNTQRKTVG